MYGLVDKNVLITGGTGSLGNALIEPLMKSGVRKIIVYSRGEYGQVQMERRFSKEQYPIRYFIGDVRDGERLHRALDDVHIVIHLAAIKHIDKAQYDPFEAVKTNVIGAENVINASIDCNVEKVVAITSDKGANPTSLYGASKQCADFMFVAANNYSPHQTKFSVIRFGNFWNSSGSFIEYLFSLKRGVKHTINVTDFRMTRFFLTLEDGANHVIYALKHMQGQEIFSPKMQSRKIIDIVKEMHPKAILNETGIRPCEKLHEDLIVKAYAKQTYETDRWFITYPHNCTLECIGTPLDENFEYNSEIALEE